LLNLPILSKQHMMMLLRISFLCALVCSCVSAADGGQLHLQSDESAIIFGESGSNQAAISHSNNLGDGNTLQISGALNVQGVVVTNNLTVAGVDIMAVLANLNASIQSIQQRITDTHLAFFPNQLNESNAVFANLGSSTVGTYTKNLSVWNFTCAGSPVEEIRVTLEAKKTNCPSCNRGYCGVMVGFGTQLQQFQGAATNRQVWILPSYTSSVPNWGWGVSSAPNNADNYWPNIPSTGTWFTMEAVLTASGLATMTLDDTRSLTVTHNPPVVGSCLGDDSTFLSVEVMNSCETTDDPGMRSSQFRNLQVEYVRA